MAFRKLVLATKQIPLPVGVKPGLYRFSVLEDGSAGEPVVQDVEGKEATFDLKPGNYSGTAVRLDSAGVSIGDTVTASFAVETEELVDVADTLTVVLV